jgi:hypothetical protein
MVTKAEYLVFERQQQWWVLIDALRAGPYVTRQVAIDSAIAAAKVDLKGGLLARVSVQNGDHMVTAYDSESG